MQKNHRRPPPQSAVASKTVTQPSSAADRRSDGRRFNIKIAKIICIEQQLVFLGAERRRRRRRARARSGFSSSAAEYLQSKSEERRRGVVEVGGGGRVSIIVDRMQLFFSLSLSPLIPELIGNCQSGLLRRTNTVLVKTSVYSAEPLSPNQD